MGRDIVIHWGDMSKLIRKTGSVFDSTAPAIAFGVNVKGRMNFGLVKQFREMHPDMFDAYKEQCDTGALVPSGLFGCMPEGEQMFYMLAYKDAPQNKASLEWLSGSLHTALEDADKRGFDRVAIPELATGTGGLDWPPVEAFVRGIAESHLADIEIWEYDG